VLGDSAILSGVKLFPLIAGFLFGAGLSAGLFRKLNKVLYLLPEGAALLTTGLGLLYLIQPDTSFGMIAGFQVIAGLGMGATMSVTAVVLQNSVAPSQMGVAMSAFSFFMLMGGALGVAAIGALVNNATTANLLAGQLPQLAICNALDVALLASASPGILVFLISWFVQDTKLIEKTANVDAGAAVTLEVSEKTAGVDAGAAVTHEVSEKTAGVDAGAHEISEKTAGVDAGAAVAQINM